MRIVRTVAGLAGALIIATTAPSSARPDVVLEDKPVSGTWTYTDFTPDPTVLPEAADHHCHGSLPSSPNDVNSQTLKVKKKSGILDLQAHNMLDWAVEIRDKGGNVVAGNDGAGTTDAENLFVALKKGTYEVIYCNFAGEPEITVDYTLK